MSPSVEPRRILESNKRGRGWDTERHETERKQHTHIARRVPAQAYLQVVVVRDEAQDFGQEILALGFGYTVDATAMQATREEGLPSRHGVRAHDGLSAVSISRDGRHMLDRSVVPGFF